MKTFFKIFSLILAISFSLWSCTDYLEKTPKADLAEEDIFSNWLNFQGYVETMYDDVVDLIHLQNSFGTFNYADDNIPYRYYGFIEGDYWSVIQSGITGFYNSAATRTGGLWWEGNIRNKAIWQNSWFGIRAANVALSRLNELVDATNEQKKFIEGQAYFFRGYFHWELMKAWGNIPYVDTLFSAADVMQVPQLGLYAAAEKILADLQKAADLLPENWDATETGKLTLERNSSRPAKGTALANMAECLLYCGSPLFNGVETGNYNYNVDYCKRAANLAWQVIELENKGIYELLPWENYYKNFYDFNRFPLTKEVIFSPPYEGPGYWFQTPSTFLSIGGEGTYLSPTHNYTEYFEMANGLPIDDPESGFNPMDPWVNRDPRFKYNFYVDRDRIVDGYDGDFAFAQLYIGGRERQAMASVTGYGWRKFVNETVNYYHSVSNSYHYNVPKIRLAEIYLIYAEAANEAYNGPDGKDPNANLTALDAINIIRHRAEMPDVNAKFLANKEAFRARIWNERTVELAYEGKRWYDLRRWYVHHLPKYRELYELQFDKEHTYFNKVLAKTINFTSRCYWLPFPRDQVVLYEGWQQNPGW